MNKKKLTKKQNREKQILEDKKFRKNMRIGVILLFLVVILINVFYIFWYDTKYTYRRLTFFGKEIPARLICMYGNILEHRESIKFVFNDNTFYACSARCKTIIINYYDEVAFVADAFSGDTICKANALIGFKERGKPNVVYFENIQNFKNYYAAKTSK